MTPPSISISAVIIIIISWPQLSLHLPFIHAQSSSNPTTDWPLSDFYNSSSTFSDYRYNNFTVCNNDTSNLVRSSSNLALINDAEGLYARCTGMYSANYIMDSVPFKVSYQVCFVIRLATAEALCNQNNPNYYLSLVALNPLGRSQDINRGQVLWTANPERPVSQNACLQLGEDSNLKLLDNEEVVWHTNTANQGAVDASLAITLEGNLVLFTSNVSHPPLEILWETFRSPTNTLMVLQALQKQSTLSVNSSAEASNYLGNYTMAIHNGHLVLYARISQQIFDDDHEDSSYGSPYWVWPNNSSVSEITSAADNITFVAFCWDPINQLRLYAGSNSSWLSRQSDQTLVSPEFCSSIPDNSETIIMSIPPLNQSVNATYATFLRLEANGDLRAYTMNNTNDLNMTVSWKAFYSVFNKTRCDLPLYCGFYGICDQQQSEGEDYSYSCTCEYDNDKHLEFGLVDASNSKSGCKIKNDSVAQLWYNDISPTSATKRNVSVCESKGTICTTQFLSLTKVHYFSLNPQFGSRRYRKFDTQDECQTQCSNDRNCSAAFWNPDTSHCFVIQGQLGTIQRQQESRMVAFVKYVSITHHATRFPWIKVGPALIAIFLMACFFLAYLYNRRRTLKWIEMEKERLLLSLLDSNATERFTWEQMCEYTCGFSDLLGSGGFGRVFRGSLPDRTAIAVKQLDEDGSQGQGNKEFIAEVSILSKIHHSHLVRLIGFCLEGVHRLLVYEYMENGSLDAWIFKPSTSLIEDVDHEEAHLQAYGVKAEVLSWKARFQIAAGTSKALAYLHEDCDEKVIHMDLKPQNILLGHNFQAKISDFGMSRRTAREQSAVMTVMRGTPGYLAPEWLLECAVTEKCDVYSFGIVLLEMVSGRKVWDLKALKQKLSMRSLRESVMMGLLDEKLQQKGWEVKEEEAVRMVEVALLCVRTDPRKRPAMSRVALMLEGKEEVQQYLAADHDLGEEENDDGDGRLVMYASSKKKEMRRMPAAAEAKAGNWPDSFMKHSTECIKSRSSSSGRRSGENSFREYFHHHMNYTKSKSVPYIDSESNSLLDGL